MALRLNFSRVFSKRFRDSATGFHRLLIRTRNFEGVWRTGLFKVVLILPRKSKYRVEPIAGKEKVVRSGRFFADLRDVVLILARIVVIGSVVTLLSVAYFVTRFTHSNLFPILLRKGIEFLGPIFIKLGQWTSTRKDIFPKDICDNLSQLQQVASPHSWTYTKHLLEATYGTGWQKLFVKFEDKVPIGSGCCAQVYKAWLDLDARVEMTEEPRVSPFIEVLEYFKLGPVATLLDGILSYGDQVHREEPRSRKLQPVAVKVLHPGLKGQLRRDLSIMKGICKCATYVVPQLQWLSLTDCIDEFSQLMENQVDMNLEAANLNKFSKNFSNKDDVIFPRPLTKFTRREILVESFHEGAPISEYLDCDDKEIQEKLAKMGIETILKMVFKDNFVHCDLHPGNILVETNYQPSERKFFASLWKLLNRNRVVNYPRLIILDCGLAVSLNDRCRQNLRNVFRSVLLGNGELAAEYILEHSSQMTPDPDGFKSTMRDIVSSHLRDSNIASVNVSTVVNELFSAMVRHRVKQDSSFSSVILSMVMIEGLGRSLDPTIDIFAEVLPFVFYSTVYDN